MEPDVDSCTLRNISALARIGPLGGAAAVALGLVVVAVAAPGDLDPTFGSGGRVAFSPALESSAFAAALQPDGRIVLAGFADDVAPPPPPPQARLGASNADFLTVRLTANGVPDSTFGSGGAVRTPVVGGNGDRAEAVAVGPRGTIVVAGATITLGASIDAAVVRYTSSGALDPSFSGDGIRTLDFGGLDSLTGVAVRADGRIVAVGRGGSLGFTVVRLRANGELDRSFGGDGIITTPIGDPAIQDDAYAVLLVDDRIVVAGAAEVTNPARSSFALVRYLADGRLDPSFGAGGIRVDRGFFDQRAWALATAPGGKIVAAGSAAGDFRVARYLATGAPDATFGGHGFAVTSFDGFNVLGRGVAVQSDGRIVVSGPALRGPPGTDEFAVARYNLDGSLDGSIGSAGKRTFSIAPRVWGGASVLQRGAAPGGGDRFVVTGLGSDGGGMPDYVAAIGVDLGVPGPAPPTPKKCRVPRVIHLKYGRARRKIRRASCEVGRVRSVRRPRFAGLVVAQSPRPGRLLPSRGRVNLVLSRKFY